MRSFFDFDSKLRSLKDEFGRPHIFIRINSLSSLPFKWQDFSSNLDNAKISHYERLITKKLTSKFAVPVLARSEFGQLVNTDEALEGIPECYRHTRPIKSILKLGLNISADYFSDNEIFEMRSAAILAIYNLAKQRGQQIQFDICYGFYGFGLFNNRELRNGHFRIALQMPTPELIKKIMTIKFRDEMINKLVQPACGNAGYRIHMFPKGLGQEFDFVLDRIETSSPEIEYQRILDQITKLR